ncbi:MAG: hypothetical protein R3A80_04105 [Bdellovibrionota bacterium]
MDIVQSFLFQLESIASELWTPQSRNLALLLSTGQIKGGLSWTLMKEYRQWGLLHLLILSGSQYYSFATAWQNINLGIQKALFRQSFPRITRILLILVSLFYLNALGSPAPLLRCALLSFALYTLSPFKCSQRLIVLIVFVLHMCLENWHPSDSAILSWMAYLMLQISNILTKNPVFRIAFVSAILHISIGFFKDLEFSFRSLLVASLANIICLPLYEKVIFPCIGYLSSLTLLLSPLWAIYLSPDYFKEFAARPLSFVLDLAIFPVLVANSTFRYTFLE